MKNITIIIILSVLIVSPLALPIRASAATATETQKTLLIQLLLEKVKSLQAELAILIKAKSDPVKVEIINQNSEYKNAVKPLVDALEVQEELRKVVLKKLEESQCIKPFRVVSKGVTRFTCDENDFKFSATSTAFVLSNSITEQSLYKTFKLPYGKITIIPAVYESKMGDLISGQKAIVPPNDDVVVQNKKLKLVDQEITDLNAKIISLKTRYGI